MVFYEAWTGGDRTRNVYRVECKYPHYRENPNLFKRSRQRLRLHTMDRPALSSESAPTMTNSRFQYTDLQMAMSTSKSSMPGLTERTTGRPSVVDLVFALPNGNLQGSKSDLQQ